MRVDRVDRYGDPDEKSRAARRGATRRVIFRVKESRRGFASLFRDLSARGRERSPRFVTRRVTFAFD